VATAGGSVHDVVDRLFAVSVATLALGLILVTAGLVLPADNQDIHYPLTLEPRGSDLPAISRPSDPIGTGSDRSTRSRATRSVLNAPSRQSRPAASPPVHGARKECGRLDQDFTRCAYIRDSANVAHGYLVPRPSTDKVY